jgi:hypothetical protein
MRARDGVRSASRGGFCRLALVALVAAAGAACTTPTVSDSLGAPTPGGVPGSGGAMTPAPMPPTFVLPPAPAPGSVAPPGTGPCVGLACQQTTCRLGNCLQAACPAGQKTTLRGKVYDPAGRVPLYNVLVYVPNAPLDPITSGPSCDRCDTPISGKPIASALTDTQGAFLLDNVPVGIDVPLVVQVGKWRREIKVPRTQACAETVMEDPNVMRLPRSREEGNIPKIALTTGGADNLECLLRKIGIADSEFTPEAGPGRVNFFAGMPDRSAAPPNPFPIPIPIQVGPFATSAYAPALNGGAAMTPARTFWDDPAAFNRYDMVILSCEGNSYPDQKSPAARAALVGYADKGGRVFASHWHNIWLRGGPAPWSQVASFNAIGANLDDPFVGEVDTSFPKGNALADWLVTVGASPTRGRLSIREGRRTVVAVDPMFSTPWIRSPAGEPPGILYFTFNTPAGMAADQQCGRGVFTDIHVSAGDNPGPPFPMGCTTTELTPQEKALEFILFDLSSCVQPDTQPPVIP